MVVGEMPSEQEGKDFFISRSGADRAWAEWIGYVLEEEGSLFCRYIREKPA